MAYDGTLKFDTKIDTSGFQTGAAKIGKLGTSALKATAGLLAGAGAALAGFGASAVKSGSEFEAGMSQVEAISGASAKEMDVLRKKASKMGATTKFTATQSAEAFKYMAMAGWDANDMTNSIAGVMNLAAASGEELGTVSDIVTDAMTAFGLSAKGTSNVLKNGIETEVPNATRFVDVLAKASSSSNTNVAMMGETFKYVAPVAGALGYSIEDTATAIGLMANSGIKGSQAGTSLRSILSRMAAPTAKVSGAMDELGISLTDNEGNMKSLDEVMVELRQGFSGLDETQKTAFATQIAGKNAMSGLLAIVNASDEDFNALTEAIKNSSGATDEMSAIMLDNLPGAVTLASSALEGLKNSIYDSIKTPLTQTVTMFTGWINDMNLAFQKDGFTGLTQVFGDRVSELTLLAVQKAPDLIDAATNLIIAFINGLTKQENLDSLTSAGTKLINTLVTDGLLVFDTLWAAGTKVVSELAKGIISDPSKIVAAGVSTITNFVTNGLEAAGILAAAGLTIVAKLALGIWENRETIIGAGRQAINNFIAGVSENFPQLGALFEGFFSALGDDLTGVVETATAVFGPLFTLISSQDADFYETLGTAIGHIVSGVLLFKSAKTVASIISGIAGQIGNYTGKITGFVAAINGIAGPVGAVLTVATIAAAGFTYAATQIDRRSEKMKKHVEEMETATESLATSTTTLKEGVEESMKSVETASAQGDVAREIAADLAALNDGTSKTAEEQAKMRSLVSQLNAIYPELNLQIDKQTGALNLTNGEMLAYVENMAAMAEAEATYEAMKEIAAQMAEAKAELAVANQKVKESEGALAEAAKSANNQISATNDLMTAYGGEVAAGYQETMLGTIADVEAAETAHEELAAAVTEATTEQANAQAVYDELSVQYAALSESIAGHEQAVADDTAALDGNTEATGANTEATGANAEAHSGAQEAVDQAKGSVDQMTAAWDGLSASEQKNAQDFVTAVDNMIENASRSIKSVDWFGDLGDSAANAKNVLVANLDGQIAAITKWREDLNYLADQGINQDLLQYLLDMGPTGADYVATFRSMSADELALVGDKWTEAMSLADLTTGWEGTLEACANNIATSFDGVPEMMTTSGGDTVMGLVNGIKEKLSEVEDAGADMAAGVTDTYDDDLEIGSPSKKMKRAGQYTVQGLINGISDKKSTVKKTVEDVSKVVTDELYENIKGKHSTNIKLAGGKAAKSLADGLTEKENDVKTAASSVGESVATGISDKEQDVSNAATGLIGVMADGITTKTPDAVSAAEAAGTGAGDAIVNTIEGTEKSRAAAAGQELSGSLASGIQGGQASVQSSASSVGSSAAEVAASADRQQNAAYNAGLQVSYGLARGIYAGMSQVISAAQAVAVSAVNAARNSLGIHSPSKVFEQEIGRNIPAGIGAGISGAMPGLIRDTKSELADFGKKIDNESLEIEPVVKAEGAGMQAARMMADGMEKSEQLVEYAASDLVTAIVDRINRDVESTRRSDFVQAGCNIVQEIYDSLIVGRDRVNLTVQEILDTVNSLQKLQEDARFYDAGKKASKSLVDGIREGLPDARKAMEDALNKVFKESLQRKMPSLTSLAKSEISKYMRAIKSSVEAEIKISGSAGAASQSYRAAKDTATINNQVEISGETHVHVDLDGDELSDGVTPFINQKLARIDTLEARGG